MTGHAEWPRSTNGDADVQPRPAIAALLAVLTRIPLVAIAAFHRLQEGHDLLSALLFDPALPHTLTDIVVEWGCATYQDLAGRFILGDHPVARTDLAQIWQQIGDPLCNAPVYEQFFRTVRAVNWMRPHYVQDHRRIVVRRGGHRSGVHRACMLSRPEINESSMPRTLNSAAGCD